MTIRKDCATRGFGQPKKRVYRTVLQGPVRVDKSRIETAGFLGASPREPETAWAQRGLGEWAIPV
jgi:hypothetical protein